MGQRLHGNFTNKLKPKTLVFFHLAENRSRNHQLTKFMNLTLVHDGQYGIIVT